MKIQWREAEYDYFPQTIEGGSDAYSRNSTIDAPIFGSDTESVDMLDRYEPQCFQVSTPGWGDELIYLPERSTAILDYLDYLLLFEDQILNSPNYYDPEKNNVHLLNYFHNLEYDWLQLVKYQPLLLELARIGTGPQEDLKLFEVGGRRVWLKKNALFVGNAPHFTLKVQKNKQHFFYIHFRDTWSFFPTSLDKLGKDLNLAEKKKERDAELGKIDFRKMDRKDSRRIQFEEYSIRDAVTTRLAAEKIRDLHKSQDMTKIRVSGPSYAIGMLYHQMDETEQMITGVNDQKIMQLIFDTYRGGRTGGIYHGRVEDISVLDFHSSYPASMTSLPSFSDQTVYIEVEDLSVENVLSIIEEVPSCFLRVDGIERDTLYPGLITTHLGKLTPVAGDFENVATTGVELCVAIKSGTLEITNVREMVAVFDLDECPRPFERFARTAYERKAAAEKGSTEYQSAKLALNSAYGKLIESRHTVMIGASEGSVFLPFPAHMEKEFAKYYYNQYLECVEKGLSFYDEYDRVVEEVYNTFKEIHEESGSRENWDTVWTEQWTRARFSSLSISGKVYGHHVNPAAASMITATSRARLVAAMKSLGALYWDTDSVFIKAKDMTWIRRQLDIGSTWLPKGIIPLTIGENLGELDLEITGAWGYLAGTKRYYLTDGTHIKKAIHGIPALSFDKVEEVITALADLDKAQIIRDDRGRIQGRGTLYESKPRPLKTKEAGTPDLIGQFKSKEYAPIFHLDSRLSWIKAEDGWYGHIKTLDQMEEDHKIKIPEYDPELLQLTLEEWTLAQMAREDRKKKRHFITERLKEIGPIRIPKENDAYRKEYESFSLSIKRKYFRQEAGQQLYIIADLLQIELRELIDFLGGI